MAEEDPWVDPRELILDYEDVPQTRHRVSKLRKQFEPERSPEQKKEIQNQEEFHYQDENDYQDEGRYEQQFDEYDYGEYDGNQTYADQDKYEPKQAYDEYDQGKFDSYQAFEDKYVNEPRPKQKDIEELRGYHYADAGPMDFLWEHDDEYLEAEDHPTNYSFWRDLEGRHKDQPLQSNQVENAAGQNQDQPPSDQTQYPNAENQHTWYTESPFLTEREYDNVFEIERNRQVNKGRAMGKTKKEIRKAEKQSEAPAIESLLFSPSFKIILRLGMPRPAWEEDDALDKTSLKRILQAFKRK